MIIKRRCVGEHSQAMEINKRELQKNNEKIFRKMYYHLFLEGMTKSIHVRTKDWKHMRLHIDKATKMTGFLCRLRLGKRAISRIWCHNLSFISMRPGLKGSPSNLCDHHNGNFLTKHAKQRHAKQRQKHYLSENFQNEITALIWHKTLQDICIHRAKYYSFIILF